MGPAEGGSAGRSETHCCAAGARNRNESTEACLMRRLAPPCVHECLVI